MEAPDPPTPDEAYEMDNFQNPQVRLFLELLKWILMVFGTVE
jgi:hypothetical protein